MNILIVSQYFHPETFRINEIATDLVKRGHKVSVLTGLPNYPEGKLYPGYRLGFQREYFEGVEVLRCPLVPRGSSSVQLILNYISFPFFACLYSLLLIERRFDRVFICQLSPIFIAIPGLFYKFFTKTKVVMWVLDLWPESLIATNTTKNPIIINVVGFISRLIYYGVDLLLVSSKGFTESINRWDISHTPVVFFPQWGEVLFENMAGAQKRYLPREDCFKLKILFAGNLGTAQGLDVILKAMSELKSESVGVYFVGEGRDSSRLKEIKNFYELDNVFFLPKVSLEEVPSFFKASDILFLSLVDDPMLGLTIPGKLQAYLASGKPVLCSATGEASEIISNSGCGLVSPARDSQKLKANILKLLSMEQVEFKTMGEAGFDYYKNNFLKENLLDSLEKILE